MLDVKLQPVHVSHLDLEWWETACMINVIEKHSNVKNHHLFLNNFFSSHALITLLAEKDVVATGTVCEITICGANKAFQSTLTGNRGDFDYLCDRTVYCMWLGGMTIL